MKFYSKDGEEHTTVLGMRTNNLLIKMTKIEQGWVEKYVTETIARNQDDVDVIKGGVSISPNDEVIDSMVTVIDDLYEGFGTCTSEYKQVSLRELLTKLFN